MIGVVLVYAGLLTLFVGGVSLIKPLRFLRVRTRKAALGVSGAGLVVVLAGMMLPAGLTRAAARESLLDAWMPEWQFDEVHSLRVHATPEQAWRAIHEVTADEIWLFRTLTWIRNPHWPGTAREGNIMNPSAGKPILEEAMAGGFRLLAEEPQKEIVLGTVVMWDGTTRLRQSGKDDAGAPFASQSAAQGEQSTQRSAEKVEETSREEQGRELVRLLLATPGNAVATINFRVRDEGNGTCTVTTETRVFATDDAARRRFARYWRVIYPGSSLLRYTWLRAIRARAEG